jgi:hypothetical protein
VNPASIPFNGLAQTVGFSATSSNPKSALSATSDKPAVATVAAGVLPGQFTVTSVGVGLCTITVSDTTGGSATIAVTVTTISLVVH